VDEHERSLEYCCTIVFRKLLGVTVELCFTAILNRMSLVLYYGSGWDSCYLHYSLNNGSSWTQVPGESMMITKTINTKHRWYRFDFNIESILKNDQCEILFCPNHNGIHWDNPPYGSTHAKDTNYCINLNSNSIQNHNAFSLVSGKLSMISSPMSYKPVFLVSDLDGTFVGNDSATSRLVKKWKHDLAPRGSVLVYNSGRSLDKFMDLQKEKNLPFPTALIGSVGTEVVWFSQEGKIEIDEEWNALLEGHGWNEKVVIEACDRLVEKLKGSCHWNPANEQNKYKKVISVKTECVEEAVRELEEYLMRKEAKARVVVSGHGDYRYVDVISMKAGKLGATQWVREKVGNKESVEFKVEDTICCGDSGNDIAMMQGNEKCVIVGNSQKELVDWYERQNEDEKGNRILYAKRNQADGILEALETFGFLQEL